MKNVILFLAGGAVGYGVAVATKDLGSVESVAKKKLAKIKTTLTRLEQELEEEFKEVKGEIIDQLDESTKKKSKLQLRYLVGKGCK